MKIEIINEDNQYIDSNVESVISVNAVNFLHKQLESPDCTLKEDIRCVLNFVTQLPVFKDNRSLSPLDSKLLKDSGIQPSNYGNSDIHSIDVYGFVTLARPNAKRPTNRAINIIEKKDESWGLSVAVTLNNKKFIAAYQKINEVYQFEEKRYGKSLESLLKKTKAMLERAPALKELDERAILTGKSDKSAVVIYSPANNGFLNYDGHYSSLLSARIFQSLKVAQNTARSRSLSYHIFVDVNLDIDKLSLSEQHNEEIGVLGEIIALKEKQKIQEQLASQPKEFVMVNALKEQFPEIYEKLLLDIEKNNQPQPKVKSSRI